MLLELTLGNFKSFRDKTIFSMIAAKLTSEDPLLDQNNVIPVKKDLGLLKSAAIYGANASGKSNLGVGLQFMRQFVADSAREASTPGSLGLEPFLLDLHTPTEPSYFEMIFLLDGTQYRYGFEADRGRVLSEWLFHVPKTKEVALFVREGQEIKVRVGFKEGKGLEIRTRPEALFLSVSALFNGPIAQKVQGWFDNFIVTTGLQDDDFYAYTHECLRDPDLRKQIVAFIKTLDLDILDLALPEMEALTVNIQGADSSSHIHTVRYIHDKNDTIHEKLKPVILFEVDRQESQGTRKLIAMAGPLSRILEDGTLLFIDELDARLHPLMTRRIIELFHSPLTNPKGAQLIFATHDTNLLDKSLFRRDQIWFTEKDPQGVTHLASLAEYRVRKEAAYEKNYLEGRYGAIPFLGDLTHLPWAQTLEGSEAADREEAYA